jgi:hypothetical protein
VLVKQERIAILTDLDPMSNAGANLVAFQYAMAAQRDFEIEFWTSVCVGISLKKESRQRLFVNCSLPFQLYGLRNKLRDSNLN